MPTYSSAPSKRLCGQALCLRSHGLITASRTFLQRDNACFKFCIDPLFSKNGCVAISSTSPAPLAKETFTASRNYVRRPPSLSDVLGKLVINRCAKSIRSGIEASLIFKPNLRPEFATRDTFLHRLNNSPRFAQPQMIGATNNAKAFVLHPDRNGILVAL